MKKRHFLFGFVDVILITFLFFFVGAIATHNFKGNERVDFSQKESVSITLRVKQMPKKYENSIKIKDSLYLDDESESIGKIKYLSFSDSSVEFLDKLTNNSAIYKSPDKIDMLASAQCEAVLTSEGYIVGDRILKAGDTAAFSVPGYSFDATIINIEKNEV